MGNCRFEIEDWPKRVKRPPSAFFFFNACLTEQENSCPTGKTGTIPKSLLEWTKLWHVSGQNPDGQVGSASIPPIGPPSPHCDTAAKLYVLMLTHVLRIVQKKFHTCHCTHKYLAPLGRFMAISSSARILGKRKNRAHQIFRLQLVAFLCVTSNLLNYMSWFQKVLHFVMNLILAIRSRLQAILTRSPAQKWLAPLPGDSHCAPGARWYANICK